MPPAWAKRHRCAAFTFKELVVVLSVALFLGGVILPVARQARDKARRISCISRHKQMGTAFRLWAGDYGSSNKFERYPTRAPTNTGGAQEWVVQGQVWPVFQLMSNELNTPRILVCPSDTRRVAASFIALRNTNLSYFVSLDADESQPEALLAGDRNLEAGGTPLPPGIATLTTNQPVGWTKAQHRQCGNVSLADGSAQQLSNARLQEVLANQPGGTNRIVIP
jgi:type II secretory pathway pseudopilin PulG